MNCTAIGRFLLDFGFPPVCPACNGPVQEQGTLCATCFARTTFVTEPACLRCGLPSFAATAPTLCAACAADPPPWSRARAAMMYDDQARRLILPFKHADRQEIAPLLAFHMARAGKALLATADVLVPVPLHRWRLLRRGFNQSALLAQALRRSHALPVLLDGLRRTRRTPGLGPLSAVARRQALAGAFHVPDCRRAGITGKRVLLIDDVMTSGATARACTIALLDAGARDIDVLVASRVADPRAPS